MPASANEGVTVAVSQSEQRGVGGFTAEQAAATGVISAKVAALTEGVVKAMFMTKIKGVLAMVLVVGLALGGIGLGVGLSTNPVVVAQEKTPDNLPLQGSGSPSSPISTMKDDKGRAVMLGDQALDGLWEDIENEGAWFRIQGSTIKWHPASLQLSDLGRKQEKVKPFAKEWTEAWICRYDLTPTPMTIDVFRKDGMYRGILVLERDTLFIALGEKGQLRPTTIQRGDGVFLLVLKRANRNTDRGKDKNEQEKAKGKVKEKTLVVTAVVESVNVKKVVITAALGENEPTRMLRFLSLEITGKKPAPAEDKVFDNAFKFVYAFNKPTRLIDVPVKSDAVIQRGKEKLQLKDLQVGGVVSLQLAPDRTTGIAIVGVRVENEKKEKP
jgi:hypothetical protein